MYSLDTDQAANKRQPARQEPCSPLPWPRPMPTCATTSRRRSNRRTERCRLPATGDEPSTKASGRNSDCRSAREEPPRCLRDWGQGRKPGAQRVEPWIQSDLRWAVSSSPSGLPILDVLGSWFMEWEIMNSGQFFLIYICSQHNRNGRKIVTLHLIILISLCSLLIMMSATAAAIFNKKQNLSN